MVTPDVGGGFGMKLFLYAEHVLTCYAARKLGRPVKWAAGAGRGVPVRHAGPRQHHPGRAGDRRRTASCWRCARATSPTWAPICPPSRRPSRPIAGTGVLASVYGFKAVYANVLGVFTNTVPVDAYRGAGRPESNYLVERLIDAAARELRIDRVEFRRRNMVPPSAMPHRTPVGKTYDSGDFHRVLDAGAGADGLRRLRRAPRRGGAARQAARLRPGVLPGSHRRRSDRARGNPLRR